MRPGAWHVQAEVNGEPVTYTCNFLFMCGGYYSYEKGHRPEFKNEGDYKGQVVHPQFWPEDLDYSGKKVAVIGSGATAMTIVPSMAEGGADVTMVQRTPTYVVSAPAKDRIANFLRRWLPAQLAYDITRFKNTKLQGYFYKRTRTQPERIKQRILNMVRKQLGDEMVEKHFTPPYNPWDQRMCLIPDADLYGAINNGSVHVVTGHIDCFTETGLRMQDGQEIEADIIVTATGLEMVVLSDVALEVDGESVTWPEHYAYKGMMYSDIPNMVQTFGYINASWTLRADLTAEYVCRLLNRMDELGVKQATPRLRPEDEGMPDKNWIDDFSAGYMQRVMHRFPRQGTGPWQNTQNYALDKKMVRQAPIDDSALMFSNPMTAAEIAPESAATPAQNAA